MPTNKSKHRGNFVQLGNYLAQEKDEDELHWGGSENLTWLDDYDTAFRVMQGTASRSPNSDRIKPCLHQIIAYHPNDTEVLTPEIMDDVAHRVAEHMGFGDETGYQYMFVHHYDKNHWHTHIAFNKVHPETYKSWHRHNDQPKLRQFIRDEVELQYGLTPTRDNGKAEWTIDKKDKVFGERIRGEIDRVIAKSKSWAELKQALGRYGENGYDVQRRGRGAVVTDGENKVKLSFFGRQHTYKQLCDRFGESLKTYEDREQYFGRHNFEARYEWFKSCKDHMKDKERLVEAAWLYGELSESSQAQRDREDKLGGYKALNSPEYIQGENLKSQEYIEGDKVINDYQETKENLGKYNDAQAAEKALRDLSLESQDSADKLKNGREQGRGRVREKQIGFVKPVQGR